MRTDDGSDDVVRGLHRPDPVAQGLGYRFLQGGSTRLHRHHLGAEQIHAVDVERLALDVLGSHVDDAVEPEQGAGGRRRHPVLSGTGLGDHARFPHAASEQGLAHGVVDLVGAGVGQVLALQPQIDAELLGQPLGVIHRGGTSHVGFQQVIQLGTKGVVGPGLGEGALELDRAPASASPGRIDPRSRRTVRARPVARSRLLRLLDEGNDPTGVLDTPLGLEAHWRRRRPTALRFGWPTATFSGSGPRRARRGGRGRGSRSSRKMVPVPPSLPPSTESRMGIWCSGIVPGSGSGRPPPIATGRSTSQPAATRPSRCGLGVLAVGLDGIRSGRGHGLCQLAGWHVGGDQDPPHRNAVDERGGLRSGRDPAG